MTSTWSRTNSAASVRQPLAALGQAVLEDDVLALDIAQLAQPLPECFEEGG